MHICAEQTFEMQHQFFKNAITKFNQRELYSHIAQYIVLAAWQRSLRIMGLIRKHSATHYGTYGYTLTCA